MKKRMKKKLQQELLKVKKMKLCSNDVLIVQLDDEHFTQENAKFIADSLKGIHSKTIVARKSIDVSTRGVESFSK